MSRFKWLTGLTIAAASALMLTGAVFAQDTTPTTIGVKEMLEGASFINGVFENGATAYLYAFEGSAGDEVSVSMTQTENSDLDPFLVLLGPNGEVIASDDDSGLDVSFSALIDNVELPDDGTYLILATSFVYIDNILVENAQESDDLEANNSFTLTVQGNTVPDPAPDGVMVDATPIRIGDSIDGESTVDNPVGYYVIKGKAGDVISLSMESADFDTILHVFAPNGDRIAVNDDVESGNTNSAIEDLELPEDGTYLIMATDVFFYSANDSDSILFFTGGEFTLTVQ